MAAIYILVNNCQHSDIAIFVLVDRLLAARNTAKPKISEISNIEQGISNRRSGGVTSILDVPYGIKPPFK
jgi:sulfur relay (sulfurtransferase) complex TusBCD TusD component (DsrE family)